MNWFCPNLNPECSDGKLNSLMFLFKRWILSFGIIGQVFYLCRMRVDAIFIVPRNIWGIWRGSLRGSFESCLIGVKWFVICSCWMLLYLIKLSINIFHAMTSQCADTWEYFYFYLLLYFHKICTLHFAIITMQQYSFYLNSFRLCSWIFTTLLYWIWFHSTNFILF